MSGAQPTNLDAPARQNTGSQAILVAAQHDIRQDQVAIEMQNLEVAAHHFKAVQHQGGGAQTGDGHIAGGQGFNANAVDIDTKLLGVARFDLQVIGMDDDPGRHGEGAAHDQLHIAAGR